MEKVAGPLLGAGGVERQVQGREPCSEAEHCQSHQERACEIKSARHAQKSWGETDGDQAERIENNPLRSGFSVGFDNRQHADLARLVVLAVEPCDRKKMRELPEEDDGKHY